MPYLKDQQLVFVHIPKNAGKSIEIALGFALEQEINGLGRRTIVNRFFTFVQRLTSNKQGQEILHGTLDISLCAQHLTLQEMLLLELIPANRSKTLKSFAVFRDPFSRAVSTYLHFTDSALLSPNGFEKFCGSWFYEESSDHNVLAHRRPQIDFILDKRGKVGVDKVLLFENLSDDFSNLCAEWGLRCSELPNVGGRSNRTLLASLWTEGARALISEIFEEDIEFYNNLAEG